MTTREYRSELRDARAADTRRRIAEAARDLFAEHGFAGTTIAGIAERAGVAAPTVYATFGSKGAILAALLTQLEADADVEVWRARIAAEPDAGGKLDRFAQWSASMFSTSRAVIAAAQGAASDPAIVALREQGDRARRAGLGALLASMAGSLRPELSERAAVDRAWLLTGLGLYLDAVEGCGWSDAEYARWLGGLLRAELLTGS